MKNKWIALDKATKLITATTSSATDQLREHISHVINVKSVPVEQCPEVEPDIKVLRARKLADKRKITYFSIIKGPNFAEERKAAVSDLSAGMLASKEWQTAHWKDYNFNSLGLHLKGGHLHPLLKIRSQFKKILFEMGFEEMPTNSFVESSFWNFDSLFQPQQHPARDAHDTFFIKDPATIENYPKDYMERVRSTHERGGYGSLGWRYHWSEDEAKKPILRTHTTAVSSRMLYRLAQEGFRPAKYFSIDRVFRNESLDATHLAEFHQVEGVVAAPGIGLADLIGVIAEFFKKIGITNLRFKPAYNPYTEPSMEIFGFHPQLNRWTEIGNSGVFRPEMLKPMGLPDGVGVIAWGLSLERPTMIQYGIDNIRELFGHKLELSKIEGNPISILGS
jgi:phenylalanyl-tRNA synthetase alpha chain